LKSLGNFAAPRPFLKKRGEVGLVTTVDNLGGKTLLQDHPVVRL
jgi:hypothetical protein